MTDDIEDDDRTLTERIQEEMVVDRDKEIARLTRKTRTLAECCDQDAPATSGFLRGVADDLREARRMFTREVAEDRDDE